MRRSSRRGGHADVRCVGKSLRSEAASGDNREGVANPSSFGKFVLTPATGRTLKADSGTETCSVSSKRVVMRQGQRVEIVNWITTCKGKRGLSSAFDSSRSTPATDTVGTGTWKVVRGTGRYTQITGGGRVGNACVDSGPWRERREGFLTLP